MSEATEAGAGESCPVCGAVRVRVEEDVSDEVTVFACEECDSTWATRTPDPGHA